MAVAGASEQRGASAPTPARRGGSVAMEAVRFKRKAMTAGSTGWRGGGGLPGRARAGGAVWAWAGGWAQRAVATPAPLAAAVGMRRG